MAPSKPKKAPSQSSTLYDFFPGFPTTPAASSSKTPRTTPRTGKTPAKPSRLKTPRVTKRATAAEEDIIVISDDEDASDARQGLKREADDDDVIVLNDTPPKAKRVCRSMDSPVSLEIVKQETTSSSMDIEDDGFGLPSALLCTPPTPSLAAQAYPTPVSASGSRALISATPSLSNLVKVDDDSDGSPASAVPRTHNPISPHASHAPSALLITSPSGMRPAFQKSPPDPNLFKTPSLPFPEVAPDVANSADDTWENGEDDILPFVPTADVEGIPMADIDESQLDHRTCPVCNTSLPEDRYVAEAHVLECAELLDISDTPEPGPTSKCLGSTTCAPTSKSSGSGNAFSLLMNNFKESDAWKEAVVAEDQNFRPTKDNGGRRKAPFYKVLQGMPVAVDAFRYGAIPGVQAYFLTHAHSDHYTNLSSSWKHGPIYCSEETAKLIIHMLSVDKKWVHPLPMDVATEIPDTGGVRVTTIDANHCPGSALFMFEGRQTAHAGDSSYKSPAVGSNKVFRYLHCGDFRANPQHVLHPAVNGKKIDTVYLDTTYLDPKYCFPPQPLVISACAELAKKLIAGETVGDKGNGAVDSFFAAAKTEGDAKLAKRNPVVVVGTYSVGKERVVKAVAQALNTTIYCDARKIALLRCESDPELHALLSSDPYASRVHLVPLGTVSSDKLKGYVDRWKGHYTHAIAFRPTGWTYTPPAGSDSMPTLTSVIAKARAKTFTANDMRPMRNSTRDLQLYGVPYSEHSSFAELTCFALSFDWGRMIATVNVGSENSRKKMGRWIERWETERKKGDGQIIPYRQPDYW